MPAAAVIPASAAYIKVAAVERLAVECQYDAMVRWTLEVGTHGLVLWVALSCLLACLVSHNLPSVKRLLVIIR